MPRLPFGDKGPVEVTWDYGGANLVLDPILGAITLSTVDGVSDVQEEGWGDSPVDAVFTGTVVELRVPMARSKLDQLIGLLDGVDSGAGLVAIFSAKAGCDMYSGAKKIVIKPLCDNVPSIINSEWILLWKCYPYREFDMGFDREAQRVHMVVFKVFVNQDSGNVGRLYKYGI